MNEANNEPTAMNLPVIAEPPRALRLEITPQDMLRQKRQIAEITKEVLQEGTHYGASFPGDKKMNLLQPGADALVVAFGLTPRFTERREDIHIDGEGAHREYTVTCTLYTRQGMELGSGMGSCSTLESKYRWRNDKRKCPACNSTSIIKTNKGRNAGGYWCVPDKGGCGANYNPGDPAIEEQIVGKIPNPDIADTYNTVLKIALKRAKVAAVILVTGCSDMFTQDVEDLAAKIDEEPAHAPAPRHEQAKAAAPAPAPAAPPVSAADLKAAGERLTKLAGRRFSTLIWKTYAKDQAQCLLTLKQACGYCEHVMKIMGERGADLIGQIVEDAEDPDNAVAIIESLRMAAEGVVPGSALKAASAAGEEAPY